MKADSGFLAPFLLVSSSGLVDDLASPIHSDHQVLDPLVFRIGTDRPGFCLRRLFLFQEHNCADVAIAICFLHPVTLDVSPHAGLDLSHMSKAAVAIRAYVKTVWTST